MSVRWLLVMVVVRCRSGLQAGWMWLRRRRRPWCGRCVDSEIVPTSKRARISVEDESRAAGDRYLVMQPALDESS